MLLLPFLLEKPLFLFFQLTLFLLYLLELPLLLFQLSLPLSFVLILRSRGLLPFLSIVYIIEGYLILGSCRGLLFLLLFLLFSRCLRLRTCSVAYLFQRSVHVYSSATIRLNLLLTLCSAAADTSRPACR